MKAEGFGVPFQVELQDRSFQPLHEYRIEHKGAEKGQTEMAECFAECEEGERFQVRVSGLQPVSDDKLHPDYKVTIMIDEVEIVAMAWRQVDSRPITFRKMYEKEGSKTVSRLLVFAPINATSDESEVTIADNEQEGLGRIIVLLEPGLYTRSEDRVPDTAVMSTATVHEVRHKVKSTVVGGDARKKAKAVPHFSFQAWRERPSYRFVFKYRNRAWLRKMGIIDSSPTPPPMHDPAPISRKRPRSPSPPPIDPGLNAMPSDEKPIELLQKRVAFLEHQNRILIEKRKMEDSLIDLTMEDEPTQ